MLVEVVLNNTMLKWYVSKGYDVPVEKVQLYSKNKKGERVKNGFKFRCKRWTRIMVKSEDLLPKSNEWVSFVCIACGNESKTTWQAYQNKENPDKCTTCQKKEIKGTGSHYYWVEKMIVKNPDARCDISGETDKRFLVLHHLISRKNGGKSEPSNYVVLSANYHLAFHNWNGGMNVPCTADQYYEFKELELSSKMKVA